ncbi:FAD-dependent oxidoreductase [Streptomyces sp. NBC_01304]|uniref:FAD-dependent oxidoreductase n=1 Tax=Streptomyces sp. NBC_01304 TaxID=2903818 RepID=UPI002E0F2352|nr:FAD-dependent monooxygenase [Streptomyces sp. NBC_01304]
MTGAAAAADGLDVLVVGGGPVGLFTAALLDGAGVRVAVLERRTGPSEHSKGATVHPRTLEVLSVLRAHDGAGLGDVLAARGRPAPATHFALLPALLDYSTLPTRYPYVLMVPQACTERLLLEHLRDRGVPVHYGQRVEQVLQDRDGIRARVDRTMHTARYLVGADGTHSLVRRQARIDFPGTEPSLVAFVADVQLADPPPQALHHWNDRSGTLSVLPLPSGLHRLYGAEPRDTRLSPAHVRSRQRGELTEQQLRSAMHRIIGTDFALRKTVWRSQVTDTTRTAVRLRAGRIFLAGDAVHAHFPAGGQGLNVGLQDAANLAWKLAAECVGRATPDILSGPASYHAERHPVAESLAHNTLAQTALMYSFTPAGAALRALVSDLVGHDPGTAQRLTGWISGLGVHYPAPLGAHPMAGRRLPEPELLDRLRPGHFLLAHRADAAPPPVSAELTAATTPLLIASTSRSFGAHAALVRPDGHVAHAWDQVPDGPAIHAAMGCWTPGFHHHGERRP